MLQGYREQRLGLMEQAQSTVDVLAAAKDASAKKGAEAVAKAGSRNAIKRAVPAPTPTPAGDERDEDDDDAAQGDSAATGDAQRQEPSRTSDREPQLFG